MALLASLFLAVAVITMVVVTSVMSGLQARIRRHIRSAEPDLTIRLKERPLPADTYRVIRSELRGEMVPAGGPLLALAPRMSTTALLGSKEEEGFGPNGSQSGQGRANTNTVKLVGIDWDRDGKVVDWDGMLEAVEAPNLQLQSPPGKNPLLYLPQGGILISQALAGPMGFTPGATSSARSEAAVVIGSFGEDEKGQVIIEPSNRTFIHVGCFHSGRGDHDLNVIYIALRRFRSFRYPGDLEAPDASYAVARFADSDAVVELAAELRDRHPGLLFETWQDNNHTLLVALAVEKTVTAAILFFIVLLSSLLLLGILYMIVVDKRRDVGILRSMGLSASRTVSVFVIYGSMLGVIGVTVGLSLGVITALHVREITDWLAVQGVQIFSPDIYAYEGIPSVVDPGTVTVIGISSLLATILASVVAAWRAVRLSPVDCLRYE